MINLFDMRLIVVMVVVMVV